MASNRHLGRIVALQSLFEHDFREDVEIKPVTERNLGEHADVLGDKAFVWDLVHGVLDHQDQIDTIIAPAAPEWPVEQIAATDKVILRIAIYEMLIKQDVPYKVVINEAVELAKAFGGENSSKFVNGVLGTVYRDHKAEIKHDEEE